MYKIEKMECGGRENSLHLLRMLRSRESETHLAISISRMIETPTTKYWVQLRRKLQKIFFYDNCRNSGALFG